MRPLVVLTLLVGLVQILLGAVRSGSLLRFVSNAVLRGFLTGVAVNIVLSQFPDLTGYTSEANNKVIRAIDTLLHPRSIDLRVFGIGLFTILVIVLVERTRAKEFSFLVALVAGSIAVKLPSVGPPDRADPCRDSQPSSFAHLAGPVPGGSDGHPRRFDRHRRTDPGFRRQQEHAQPRRNLPRHQPRLHRARVSAMWPRDCSAGCPLADPSRARRLSFRWGAAPASSTSSSDRSSRWWSSSSQGRSSRFRSPRSRPSSSWSAFARSMSARSGRCGRPACRRARSWASRLWRC